MHNYVIVGLGGNIGGKKAVMSRFEQVRHTLGMFPWVLSTLSSSLYQSSPIGPVVEQSEFFNAVLALEVDLSLLPSPFDILRILKKGEVDGGRSPSKIDKGPREIDVDLLFVGNQEITQSGNQEIM